MRPWVYGVVGVVGVVAGLGSAGGLGSVAPVAAVGAAGAAGDRAGAADGPSGGPRGGAVGGGPAGWGGAPAGFAALREVDPSVRQDMRYASARNFTGAPVPGYEEPVCLLSRPAAEALRRAQRGLSRRGYSLVLYDCYRPQRAVDHFVRWAADAGDQSTKAAYYPRVEKSRLVAEGYIAERSGHSRGSAVDVGLTGPGGLPLDMGTPFDFFDPLSHAEHPGVGAEALANRRVLRAALEEQGFTGLREEWWHFRLVQEPYPARYFDFPVRSAAVRP
ncbi:M15 family metallopeptidase [Streptomyces sp. NPDC012888]|uniref:M15 family metallopeptidase n=1 Tax=Streptomyces sp. NPDC012888 TaxID=3364855 RepID=UPI0036A32AB3